MERPRRRLRRGLGLAVRLALVLPLIFVIVIAGWLAELADQERWTQSKRWQG